MTMTRDKLPAGKGMFLWLIGRLVELHGSFERVAKAAKEADFDWVAIKATDGEVLFNQSPVTVLGKRVGWRDDLIEPMIDAFLAEGIEVWLWGYPYGFKGEGEANIIIHRIAQFKDKIAGWVFDPEKEYRAGYKKNWRVNDAVLKVKEGLSAELINRVRRAHPDVPLGCTTYRFPSNQGDFPWEPWLTLCDFQVPQVYWIGARNPVEQLERSIREYEDLMRKFGAGVKPIIPAGALYPEGRWAPTEGEILAFAARAVELGLPGYTWWEWYYGWKMGFFPVLKAAKGWEDTPPPSEPEPGLDEVAIRRDERELVLDEVAAAVEELRPEANGWN